MVTASHNAKQDNGLKIFQKDGEMLEQTWEKLSEGLVNTSDISTFLLELNDGKLNFPGVKLQENIFA